MADEISVIAIAQARTGYGALVEAAIRPCIPATRAEAGCLLYCVHHDRASPERFVFVERWSDADALGVHTATPHFKAMERAMTPYLERPLSIMVLDALA